MDGGAGGDELAITDFIIVEDGATLIISNASLTRMYSNDVPFEIIVRDTGTLVLNNVELSTQNNYLMDLCLEDSGTLAMVDSISTSPISIIAKDTVTMELTRSEIDGSLDTGDTVKCILDWEARHRNMRAHTAGHVLHDALVSLPHPENIFPIKGNHKKCYVEYSGDPIPPEIAGELERKCNEIIAADLATHIRSVDLPELRRICKFVPPNLPADKPLRVLWLDGYDPMPCGGTHVRRTGEIGSMKILRVGIKRRVNHIKYQIE